MTNAPLPVSAFPSRQQLSAYLELAGWQRRVPPSEKWVVYEAPSTAGEKPFEIVIPTDNSASDLPNYIQVAVNLLSSLANESPDATAKRVRLYDRDVFTVRNLEGDEYNSITLKLAARQVNELKQLVAYSACSERDPRPYFPTHQLAAAKDMVSHYRFGHTFAGSFGFTIEAPILHAETAFVQLALLDEPTEPLALPPIERRVMERIYRGISDAERATKEQDADVLIQGFPSGLNANMCKSLVSMSRDKSIPIEYSVLWSPKLPPPLEPITREPVRLWEPSYTYLDYAAKKLRELKFEPVTIRGLVVALSSKDAPLGIKPTDRSVVVKWTNRPDGRPVNVIVPLEKEEYVLAHRAHLEWQTVEVTGVVRHIANLWRLSEPRGFRVRG
jgi:hypothetical protein